jgi:DNA-binding GntR family transcriptional regulator
MAYNPGPNPNHREARELAFRASNNLDEQIAEYLTDRVIRGELQPGERIREARLAQELGVSRAPVREALRILERKRLVKLIPRRGARVTEISVSDIVWLYDILNELYSLVARKAAENRTQKDLARIRRALRKIESCAASGDVSGYYDAIFEYASIGQQAARNPLLDQTLKDLEPSTRRAQFASLAWRTEDLKDNVTFFEQAARHVEDRNAEMASQTIRAYVQNEKEFALSIRTKSGG